MQKKKGDKAKSAPVKANKKTKTAAGAVGPPTAASGAATPLGPAGETPNITREPIEKEEEQEEIQAHQIAAFHLTEESLAGVEPAIIATDPLSSELDTDEIDDEDSDPPDDDEDDDDLEDETDEEDDDLDEEEDLEDEEDPSRLDLEDEEDSEASVVSEEHTGSSSLPHPGPRRHQYLLDRLHDDSGEDTPPPSSRGRTSESPHHPVDPETQSRLEALLEAAGIGSIEESNPNLADPEVLKRLTSSVSSALDEAAAALTRMRSDPPAEGRTLVEACTEGDIKKVQKLLHEGRVSVNDTTEEGESLLSLACSAGYFELAQVLIAMRANIEDRGMKGDCTPLMEAASAGHLDIVKLLINHGANVNAQSQSGNTPLMHACAGGHEAVVKALLDAGANVEDHNENGHTPLMEAASAGHVGVAKILLKFGAGINTHSNEFKESALTLACYKGHLEMVRFLLDAGADQEHKTDEMHTALMEASMDGHVEVAKLLLDHGAQVNMPADSFESPLTLAACGGHVDLAMLLLERGANIEEVNDEGYTPLMEASREGHEEMVALLLSQGADINAQTDETQETALTLACCGGFLEVADFLYKAGADIELGASTPLMEASQEGHLDLVRYLLKMGAFVNAVTTTGDTALTYACENGHTDVAELLLMANAELEHESEGGRTPLMKAARSGHLSTVEFLLEKGADVNRTTSNNDHTPLSLACGSGHQGVVDVLLQNGADPYHKLKDNSTMLIEAAKGGHTTVVQLLIDYPNNYPVVEPPPSSSLSSTLIDRVTGLPLDNTTGNHHHHHPSCASSSGAPSPSTALCAAEGTSCGGAGQPTVSLPVKSVLRKNQRGTPSNFVPGTPNKEASSGGKVAKTNHANNASSSSLLHADSSGYDYFENSKFVLEGLADKGLDAKSYIQSMLNRTENATKEEQIQEKEQIVLELKRVERELQEKAEAQQKLLRESGEGSSNPPKAVSSEKRMLTSKEILQYIANRPGGASPNTSGALAAVPASSSSSSSASTVGGSGDGPAMLSQRALANMPPSERPKAKPSRKIEKAGAKKESPGGVATGSATVSGAGVNVNNSSPAGVVASTSPGGTPLAATSTSSSQQLQAALQQHSQQLAQLQQLQQLNQQLQQQVHQQRQLKQQNQATLAALQQNAIANQQQLAALQQNVAQLQQLEQHILSQQQQQQQQQEQTSVSPATSEPASSTSIATSSAVVAPPATSTPTNTTIANNPTPSSASSSSSSSITTTPSSNNTNQHHQLQQRVQQILQQKQQLQQQIKQFQLQVEQQLAYTQHTTTTSSSSSAPSPSNNTNSNAVAAAAAAAAAAKNKRNKDGAKSSNSSSSSSSSGGSTTTNNPEEAAYEYVQAPQANQAVQALYHQVEGGPKGVVVSPSSSSSGEIEPLTQDPALLSSLDTSRIESQIAGLKNINISLERDNPALLDYKDGLHAAVLQYSSMALGGPGALMSPDEASASFGNQLLLQPPQFPFGQGADMNFLADGSNYFGHPQDTIYLSGGGGEQQPDLPQIGLDASAQHLQSQDQVLQQQQQQGDPSNKPKKVRNVESKKGSGNPGLSAGGAPLDLMSPAAGSSSTDHPNVATGGDLFAAGGGSNGASGQLDQNALCQLSGQGGPTPLVDLDSETDSNHDTALTLACAGGHEELVTLLLDRGANIEHRDKKGFTPLILAATAGHEKVVEILLEHSADIEAQSERTKDTPLSLACSGGRYEVVDILLSRNANKEHRNVSDYTPLSLAASGGYVNIIKLLLSHGAEINSRTGSKLGISPLMLAAMNGHTAAVKLLLDMGSDINAQIETNRNTALTLACFQGRHEVVSLLLDRKANVEHRAKTGLTPLMEAASGGYVEVGRVLLDKGADANAPPVPSSRDTALTIAADKGHYRFVELLLSHAAQVDVRNKKGNSSLWLACNGGHLDVVQLLYTAAADIDSQDNRKVSCLMAAFRKGHQKVVKWMVKHVNQFPSDQELTRYINTISVSDKDLLKKTEQCKEIIRVAKERQAAEAAKNASILLEELDRESKLEQSKREAAARKREKKKRKKAEKMVKNNPNDKENGDDEGSKNEDDEDKENSSSADVLQTVEDERDQTPDNVITSVLNNEGDSGIDANSQGSAASHESSKKDELSNAASNAGSNDHANSNVSSSGSNNKKKKNKKNKNKEKEKNERNQEERGCSPAAPPPLQTVREEPKVVVPLEERKDSLEMSRVPKTPEGRSVSISGLLHHGRGAGGRGGKALLTGANGNPPPARNNRLQFVEKTLANLTLGSGTSPKKPPTSRNSPGTDHKAHLTHSNSSTVGEKQHLQAHRHSDAASTGWKEVVRKSKKVSVPSNAISRVIGRGGCNINAIRELSGAHIEVEKQSSKGGVDRTILIKGSADATRQANTWIQEIINNPEKDMADIIGKPFKQLQQQQQQQQVQQQTLVVTNKQQPTPQPLMSKLAMGQQSMPVVAHGSKSNSMQQSMMAGGLTKSNASGSSKSPQMANAASKSDSQQRNVQPAPKAPFPGTPVAGGKPGKPSSFAAVAGGSDGGSPVGMIATGAHPGSQRPMGSFGSSPLPSLSSNKRDREEPMSTSKLETAHPGSKMDSGFSGFNNISSSSNSGGNNSHNSSTSVGTTPTANVVSSLALASGTPVVGMTNSHANLNSGEYSPFKYKMEWNTSTTTSSSLVKSSNIDVTFENSTMCYQPGPPMPSTVDMSKAPGFNRANLGSPGPGVLAAGSGASWLSKSPGSNSDPTDSLYQTRGGCNSAPGTPMSPNVPAPIGPPPSSSGASGSKSTLSPGSEPDYFRPQVTPISSAPGASLGRNRFSPVGPSLGGAGVQNNYNSGRAMTPDSELDHIRGSSSMVQNRPSSVAGMDKKDFYSSTSVSRYGGVNGPPKPNNTLDGINLMNLASQLSNVPGFQDLMSNGSPTSDLPSPFGDYTSRPRFNNPSLSMMSSQQPPQQQHGGPKLNPHAPDFMRPPGDTFKMGNNVMSGPPPMRTNHPPGTGMKNHGYYGSTITTSSGGGIYQNPNPNISAAMSALSGHTISSLNQSLQPNHDFNYDLSNLGGRSLKEITDMLGGTGDFDSSIPPPSGPPPYMNSPPVGMMDNDSSRFSRPIGAERRVPLGIGGLVQHQQPPPPLKMSNWDLYGSSDLTNGGGSGGMTTIPSSFTGHTLESLMKGAPSFNCSQSGGGMMNDYNLMGSGLQSPATSIGMSPNVTPTKNNEFGAYSLSGPPGSAGKKIGLSGVGFGDPSSVKRNMGETWTKKWQD